MLATALAGAALTWSLPSIARVGLGAAPVAVERERALLAAVRELRLPVTTIRRSTVQLPEDELGPAPALVLGRTLLLSPALDRHPARRALVVATVGAASVGGLGAAWFGAVALIAGAYLDGPFEALTPWTSLPAVLLVPPTLLWLRARRGVRRVERSLDPSEVVDASVEVAWLAFRQFAVDDTVVRLEPAEPRGSGRYVGKFDPTRGERIRIEGNRDELAIAWPLVVDGMRDVEAELGAPPGTAEAAARRLANGGSSLLDGPGAGVS